MRGCGVFRAIPTLAKPGQTWCWLKLVWPKLAKAHFHTLKHRVVGDEISRPTEFVDMTVVPGTICQGLHELAHALSLRSVLMRAPATITLTPPFGWSAVSPKRHLPSCPTSNWVSGVQTCPSSAACARAAVSERVRSGGVPWAV